MSLNSSIYDDSLLHLNLSSSSVSIPFDICFIARPSAFIFATFYIANIITLAPLCGLIIYIGLKRQRQQRSSPTASLMSHSDSFTYHMVTMELIAILGFILCVLGVFTVHINTYFVGFCLWGFTWYVSPLSVFWFVQDRGST
ncbi:uncharacterized protein LOC127363544 isoform X2 [Xyrichtys novacula]|uniref:Uncharacterized protein LOC127363544 isoform X2 n=1 Tax=Xyrichtys novacula TaxID=13765 RepID=A0AAV1HIC1_XYRNO|nr:uncharacterized protein LOC127363544 isoform X2 [Xyrichtys novacula]